MFIEPDDIRRSFIDWRRPGKSGYYWRMNRDRRPELLAIARGHNP